MTLSEEERIAIAMLALHAEKVIAADDRALRHAAGIAQKVLNRAKEEADAQLG